MHCSHACRCHGSKFDVTNGAVVNGPAQDPVETYETRDGGRHLED
jgi:nitrite reductase/ring-hydroxylating ferredoxin subunit